MVVYDGGTPCPGSNRPRLQCSPPINLGLDGGVFYGWLGVNDDALLLAQIRPAVPGVELRRFFADGGESADFWPTPSAATTISVSGAGSQWAVAWVSPTGGGSRDISCVSSSAPGVVSTVDAGVDVDEVSVSVTRLGGIGIAGREVNYNTARMGADRAGCPTGYTAMQKPGIYPLAATGVSATVLPSGTEVTDFRFVAVEDANTYSGGHGTFGFLADGGVEAAEYLQFGDPSYDVSAAMSGDGTVVMISYSGSAADGGYSLNVKPMPTDYSSPSAVGREVLPEPRFWGSALCGPACYVSTAVLKYSPTTLRAAFVSADSAYADLAGGSWDIACARSSSPTNAIPVTAFGKLYVLYSDPGQNQLYACDLPPGL